MYQAKASSGSKLDRLVEIAPGGGQIVQLHFGAAAVEMDLASKQRSQSVVPRAELKADFAFAGSDPASQALPDWTQKSAAESSRTISASRAACSNEAAASGQRPSFE